MVDADLGAPAHLVMPRARSQDKIAQIVGDSAVIWINTYPALAGGELPDVPFTIGSQARLHHRLALGCRKRSCPP
jgi:hypothetical protein